jgi:hypothetical protein
LNADKFIEVDPVTRTSLTLGAPHSHVRFMSFQLASCVANRPGRDAKKSAEQLELEVGTSKLVVVRKKNLRRMLERMTNAVSHREKLSKAGSHVRR